MSCMDQYPGRPIGARHLFLDRRDAGAILAEWLAPHEGGGALVLGIPRGGVIVAAEVAARLEADLDILVARKLPAPRQPELAIGAVTASGGRWLNGGLIRQLGVPKTYVDAVTAREMDEARRREERYRAGRPAADPKNRTVLLVDDGLATGATMRAAVQSVLQHDPARVVAAVPVGTREACGALLGEADDVVCPYLPEPFHAVGQFYITFEQLQDADVETALAEFHAGRWLARSPRGARHRTTMEQAPHP